MLMLLIVMFEDPSNVESNHISEQYWTMLKRWLTKIIQEQEESQVDDQRIEQVETVIPALARCISILSVMMELEPELTD